jgi:predicted RNA-binding protein with PIN domain
MQKMKILKKSKFYLSIKDKSDIVNEFVLELIERIKSKYGVSIHYTDTSSSGDLRIEKLINSKSLNAVTIDW